VVHATIPSGSHVCGEFAQGGPGRGSMRRQPRGRTVGEPPSSGSMRSIRPEWGRRRHSACRVCRQEPQIPFATTTEGIETEEQFVLARAAGCREVQGYLFGRPVPIFELTFVPAGQQKRGGSARRSDAALLLLGPTLRKMSTLLLHPALR
jgi:hypothetical protein